MVRPKGCRQPQQSSVFRTQQGSYTKELSSNDSIRMHLPKDVHRIKARPNPSTERGGGQEVPPFAEGFLATWLLGEGQLVLFKIVTPDRSATLQGSTWVNTNRILCVLKKRRLEFGWVGR